MSYLTREPIDLGEWHRLAIDARDGASVEFAGIVRGTENGIPLGSLDYEAYEPMAERVIARLVEQARQRWPVHQVCVQHRFGRVPVGHLAFFVGVRAAHRHEAFEACQFLIEEIKREAPIWKTAIAADGTRLRAGIKMTTVHGSRLQVQGNFRASNLEPRTLNERPDIFSLGALNASCVHGHSSY